MFGIDNKQLEALLDLLGQWHDHQISYDHIVKAIYTGGLSKSECDAIIDVKLRLISDKENLYDKVVAYYANQMADHQKKTKPMLKVSGEDQTALLCS
jgi:hypothetical protein